jgi:hypothetical protein
MMLKALDSVEPSPPIQTEKDQARMEYTRDFEESLRQRVVAAVENDDELVANSVMFSLFSPSEIIAGAHAGHSLGLALKDAVACFVVATRSAADEQAEGPPTLLSRRRTAHFCSIVPARKWER